MKKLIQDYIELRVVVGFLGSKQIDGWWDIDLLSKNGCDFLAHIFPRSNINGAITATVSAAQIVHDQKIGVGNAFHLFRLPALIESELFSAMKDNRLDFQLPESRENGLSRLEAMKDEISDFSQGAKMIGQAHLLGRRPVTRTMASYYHAAFSDGFQTFPYLTENGE